MWLDIPWIDSLAAFRAGQLGAKVVPTAHVSMEKRRPILSRKVLIPPVHKPNQDRIHPQTPRSQAILKARRRILVGHFGKNIMVHQMGQPFRQNASRDAEPRLKGIKAADTQKRLPQDK
jgi:hypothetical protein